MCIFHNIKNGAEVNFYNEYYKICALNSQNRSVKSAEYKTLIMNQKVIKKITH